MLKIVSLEWECFKKAVLINSCSLAIVFSLLKERYSFASIHTGCSGNAMILGYWILELCSFVGFSETYHRSPRCVTRPEVVTDATALPMSGRQDESLMSSMRSTCDVHGHLTLHENAVASRHRCISLRSLFGKKLWRSSLLEPELDQHIAMPARATTTIQSLQKATAREEKQLEKRKVKLVRLQIDTLLDARPDLHGAIHDFAERLAKKNPKGQELKIPEEEAEESISKAAGRSSKRAPDRDEHMAKHLEEWQRNISRLSADDLSLILYGINAQLFTSYNLANLRTSKKQRVIPKTPLLQIIELLTNFSPEEPLVPPFVTTIGDVANMVSDRACMLGNRDLGLTWPLVWETQGLYLIDEQAEESMTITQRFSKQSSVVPNGKSVKWRPGAKLMVANNFSYTHAAVITEEKHLVLTLRMLFTDAGDVKVIDEQSALTVSWGRLEQSPKRRRLGFSPKKLSPLAKGLLKSGASAAKGVSSEAAIPSVAASAAVGKKEEEEEAEKQEKEEPENDPYDEGLPEEEKKEDKQPPTESAYEP